MSTLHSLLWLYWNPPREMFTIPIIDRPVLWYGFLFVLGFIIGYRIAIPLIKETLKNNPNIKNLDEECRTLADKLLWVTILSALIGARLGHVFFYSWPAYKNNLLDIFKVWEGGLASHGGILAIMIALWVFTFYYRKQYPELSFLRLLDIVCIPSALAGCFIRLGNFVNQEILGTTTTVPWAVVFGDPADGSLPVPRHPVQLYEALSCLAIFILLRYLWSYSSLKNKPGRIVGLFFVLLFIGRLIAEHFKEAQSIMLDESMVSTGQLLSIPFLLLGLFLLFRPDFRFKFSNN